MNEPLKSFNKICGRLCVEMTGHLSSPLAVGSGAQEHSDGDVSFNAQGVPYIPGSSLAGAFRAYGNEIKDKSELNRLFGMPKNGVPGQSDDRQSRIIFYDADIKQAETGIRDGVKLNENKTPIHMAKYNRQFVERHAALKLRMEIIEREDCLKEHKNIQDVWEDDLKWIFLWFGGFSSGELRLGARSHRGFGKIEMERIRIKMFDMRDRQSHLEWLDWDWEQADAFTGQRSRNICVSEVKQKIGNRVEHCLEVPLCITGTLLVRSYTASFTKKKKWPDYGQMTVGEEGEQSFIPGSSLAGAFRSHIAKIIKELGQMPGWVEAQKKLDSLFGTWNEAKEKNEELHASRVIFEDAVVEGGHGLPTARVAIDRFTGGTVQAALYEEIPWAGGNILLRIRWKKNVEKNADEMSNEAVCGILLWAIKDLQAGILPVGGETSVGRGIFEPQDDTAEIRRDGELLSDMEQRRCMQAAALWAGSAGKTDDKEAAYETV